MGVSAVERCPLYGVSAVERCPLYGVSAVERCPLYGVSAAERIDCNYFHLYRFKNKKCDKIKI